MAATHYIACDLGAESGRVMLGSLCDGRLVLEELHRFPNNPVTTDTGSLAWNVQGLFRELEVGLEKASRSGISISGISTDSWGVDYLLFNDRGEVMEPTFHYRDTRCEQGERNALSKVSWPTIFEATGIQSMAINTLCQLAAESPERLASASMILGIADGFNYLLSGVARFEESLASTTQLYDPRKKDWSDKLIEALGLPRGIFPDLCPSGTRLGKLQPRIARDTGLGDVEVLAGCSHDTGAAVAAVPAGSGDWAYLSSGTWSLMGVELGEPVLTERCRDMNLTNEIGFDRSVRLLKNIIGLWLVQECRRDWAVDGAPYDYTELTALAANVTPFRSLLNPADPRFVAPGDMTGRIASYCRETGQPAPEQPGEFIRCILESLALFYAQNLEKIQSVSGKSVSRLHVVGGGSRNELLNQFTANATGIDVLAGPAEATAAGNILIQAIATGNLPSLAAAREVVRNSTTLIQFDPKPDTYWREARRRFESLPC